MASLGLAFAFVWIVVSFWVWQDLVIGIIKKTDLPSWKFIKVKLSISQKIPKFFVWSLSLLCIMSGFYVIQKIDKVTEAEKFFAEDHSLTVSLKVVSEKLNGLPVADALLQASRKITYEEKKIIHQIEKKILAKWPNVHLMSPTILLRQAQLATTGQDGLPTNEFMANMKMNGVPPILRKEMSQETLFKISILSKDATQVSQKEWQNALDDLVSQLELAFPHMQVKKTGLNYFVTESQLDLLQSLVTSFFVGFIFTTLVTGILMRETLGLAIFVMVNIAPLTVTLLFFPLLGLTLNMTTIMTFSICFGLIVDGTLHLLLTKDIQNEEKLLALESPIFFSNLILIIGFLVLLAHPFAPVWQFGLVISLILFWGLMFDLLVLPLLKKESPKN
jgi:predicted RND superfamily exporter protein